jgi:hypothetical protein
MVIHLLMRFKPDSGAARGKWSPWSVLDKHNVTPSECPHAIINVPGDYTYMPPTGTANR